MYFNSLDWLIIGLYAVGLISLALIFQESLRELKEVLKIISLLVVHSLGSNWCIPIAANISAEQIIGMSGEGFVVGMAIAVWELTAAIALIVMANFSYLYS